MYIVITTCATSRSTFATSTYNTRNITLKLLKHLKHNLITWAYLYCMDMKAGAMDDGFMWSCEPNKLVFNCIIAYVPLVRDWWMVNSFLVNLVVTLFYRFISVVNWNKWTIKNNALMLYICIPKHFLLCTTISELSKLARAGKQTKPSRPSSSYLGKPSRALDEPACLSEPDLTCLYHASYHE
jgi:hypothetical protein